MKWCLSCIVPLILMVTGTVRGVEKILYHETANAAVSPGTAGLSCQFDGYRTNLRKSGTESPVTFWYLISFGCAQGAHRIEFSVESNRDLCTDFQIRVHNSPRSCLATRKIKLRKGMEQYVGIDFSVPPEFAGKPLQVPCFTWDKMADKDILKISTVKIYQICNTKGN